jgi:hypothetical protein
MPSLISEEKVGFEIKLLDTCNDGSQIWQNYELILYVNGKARRFYNQAVRHCEERSDEAIPLVELSDQTVGRFRFNLSERNEIKRLQEQLEQFTSNPSKQELFFEPADPSFELHIERTRHSDNANKILSEEDYKVYLWVDAGNSTRLMYSWDAEGLRFLVTKTAIKAFTEALKIEQAKVLL